jgi:hypothetical protein
MQYSRECIIYLKNVNLFCLVLHFIIVNYVFVDTYRIDNFRHKKKPVSHAIEIGYIRSNSRVRLQLSYICISSIISCHMFSSLPDTLFVKLRLKIIRSNNEPGLRVPVGGVSNLTNSCSSTEKYGHPSLTVNVVPGMLLYSKTYWLHAY